jgi:hypothetical protein
MDYEDRLRVWCVVLKMGMAYWNGRCLLIPLQQAVEELNASPEVGQLRAAQLKRIVAEFKDTAPPYSSFDPRLKLRAEKKQERAAERAAKHRAYMRERMREKRAAVEQVPHDSTGPKARVLDPPRFGPKLLNGTLIPLGNSERDWRSSMCIASHSQYAAPSSECAPLTIQIRSSPPLRDIASQRD